MLVLPPDSSVSDPPFVLKKDMRDAERNTADGTTIKTRPSQRSSLSGSAAKNDALSIGVQMLCIATAFFVGVSAQFISKSISRALFNSLFQIRLEVTRRQPILKRIFLPQATRAVVAAFRVFLWTLLFVISAIVTSNGRQGDKMVGKNVST